MFKNPFGFEGRITRKEYGISLLMHFTIAMLTVWVVFTTQSNYWLLIILFPSLWFMFAQGVKRCHDFGRSGWYLMNPLNINKGGAMLIRTGDEGENEFGLPPEENQ
jgi:uncharacterized membrane protein YhaH (DUF805 family)